MKIINLLLMIISTMLLLACDPMDDRVVIINNSDKNIHIRMLIINNSKVDETMIGIRDISMNKEERLGKLYSWESEFVNINNDSVMIIVYKDYPILYNKNERSTKIKSDSLLRVGDFEYKMMSYEDLENAEWRIEYPNPSFRSGIKLHFFEKYDFGY